MVDLNSLLNEVSKEILPNEYISSKDIVISKFPEIESVPLQLKQLFIELFENSMKFRSLKRKLKIKIYPVNKKVKDLDNNIIICFEDNGMGFNQEYEEKIFKIFEKLSDSKKIGSTGIGLPIIKKITEVHGGSVSAKGTPGKGSKFYITLPLKQS
jgi:signal transduction histidine kinase